MRTYIYTGLLFPTRGDRRRHAMRRGLRVLIPICLPLLIAGPADSQVPARKYPDAPSGANVIYAKKALQGFGMRVWISNQMAMGQEAWDGRIGSQDPPIGCEYPPGSGIEHIYGAGPWIGGIVNGSRHVSEGYNGNDASKYILPDVTHPLRERIWRTSAADSLTEPNRRGCDDDNDGRIDEDDLDGHDNDGDWDGSMDDVGADGLADINETGCRGGYDAAVNPDPAFDNFSLSAIDYCHPDADGNYRRKNDPDIYTELNRVADHGEPNVDEDYGAVSDNDLYCEAGDMNQPVVGHHPMGIKVVQKSYAWRDPRLGAVLPFEYSFINIDTGVIHNVYVGFFMDADVGGVTGNFNYAWNNYSCFIPGLRLGYVHNPIDRGSTPIGITILKTPKPLDSLDFIFQWFNLSSRLLPDPSDSTIYIWMSGELPWGPIAECQSAVFTADTRFLISMGPFDDMGPGDTLRFTMALVSGTDIERGDNSLEKNATTALFHHDRGWRFSDPPPPPALRVSQESHRVKLTWGPSVGGPDPAAYWDPANILVSSYPEEHWRRVDPPCGVALPGFGCSDPFQCDSTGMLPGGRTFEGYRLYRSEDQGDSPPASSFVLLHDYDVAGDGVGIDAGIDSVFEEGSLPYDKRYWYAVTSYSIPDMRPIEVPGGTDTLRTSGVESAVTSNMVKVDVSARASEGPGEVLVVPNPAKGDAITFTRLPRSCTIRVYTVAGDIIATTRYQAPAGDPDKGEMKWFLVSGSGRPLSSDLYVYSVESEFGTQLGKFVVIR